MDEGKRRVVVTKRRNSVAIGRKKQQVAGQKKTRGPIAVSTLVVTNTGILLGCVSACTAQPAQTWRDGWTDAHHLPETL